MKNKEEKTMLEEVKNLKLGDKVILLDRNYLKCSESYVKSLSLDVIEDNIDTLYNIVILKYASNCKYKYTRSANSMEDISIHDGYLVSSETCNAVFFSLKAVEKFIKTKLRERDDEVLRQITDQTKERMEVEEKFLKFKEKF